MLQEKLWRMACLLLWGLAGMLSDDGYETSPHGGSCGRIVPRTLCCTDSIVEAGADVMVCTSSCSGEEGVQSHCSSRGLVSGSGAPCTAAFQRTRPRLCKLPFNCAQPQAEKGEFNGPSIFKPIRRMALAPSCKQLIYRAMQKSQWKE